MSDDPATIEARSRLLSVLSVLEHEGAALRELDDGRLTASLNAMQQARTEVVAALASLGAPAESGDQPH